MKALSWQLEQPFAADEVMVHQVSPRGFWTGHARETSAYIYR